MAAPSARLPSARHLGSGRISAVFPSTVAATAGGGGSGGQLQLLDAKGKPLGEPVSAMVRAEGGFARMRARIDPRLAPGRYAAKWVGEAGSEKLEIVVDPVVALRIDPPVLKIEGAAKDRVETSVTIANAGNVPAELPGAAAFGTFPRSGVEDAIGKAYRSDAEDGLQTLSRFIEGLRANYGGMIRVKLAAVGPVPPGEARTVQLTLELPDRLQAGRRYSGIWPLLNLNYSVQISATGAQRPRRKGADA